MSADGQPATMVAAAESMAGLRVISQWVLTAICLILATIGLYWGWRRVAADYRARQSVERVMENLLLACACLAIFTTVGIVFSVLFESIQFF